MSAYLAVLNIIVAVRASPIPKLAFRQMSLPLSKNTSPWTLSLVELALDHKFGYLLPHKLVGIVILKKRDGEGGGSAAAVVTYESN